jgi:hypothetical protein
MRQAKGVFFFLNQLIPDPDSGSGIIFSEVGFWACHLKESQIDEEAKQIA